MCRVFRSLQDCTRGTNSLQYDVSPLYECSGSGRMYDSCSGKQAHCSELYRTLIEMYEASCRAIATGRQFLFTVQTMTFIPLSHICFLFALDVFFFFSTPYSIALLLNLLLVFAGSRRGRLLGQRKPGLLRRHAVRDRVQRLHPAAGRGRSGHEGRLLCGCGHPHGSSHELHRVHLHHHLCGRCLRLLGRIVRGLCPQRLCKTGGLLLHDIRLYAIQSARSSPYLVQRDHLL